MICFPFVFDLYSRLFNFWGDSLFLISVVNKLLYLLNSGQVLAAYLFYQGSDSLLPRLAAGVITLFLHEHLVLLHLCIQILLQALIHILHCLYLLVEHLNVLLLLRHHLLHLLDLILQVLHLIGLSPKIKQRPIWFIDISRIIWLIGCPILIIRYFDGLILRTMNTLINTLKMINSKQTLVCLIMLVDRWHPSNTDLNLLLSAFVFIVSLKFDVLRSIPVLVLNYWLWLLCVIILSLRKANVLDAVQIAHLLGVHHHLTHH